MLDLKQSDLKKIIERRDPRYDGRFYFGVKTTRIYCRSVCPAKPKAENIVIFKSTSEAEKNGYRPCKRCRPDIAPGSKFFDGTLNSISRALRIISESDGEELDVKKLATYLGISDRHLRRLFDEHLGASPIEVMITHRLHFAKQLVQSTKLPVQEIVMVSGFKSTRRFNEVFKERFFSSPSEMRVIGKKERSSDLELRIPVRLPYDWKTVFAYLSRHECWGCERTLAGRYHRYIPLKNGFGTVTVSDSTKSEALTVQFNDIPLGLVKGLLSQIKNLFDSEHNPAFLPHMKTLSPNGIRVPGCFDPFETAISIILSQFVSTQHAKSKLKSLVRKFGRRLGEEAGQAIYEFPSPEILSSARIEEIGVMKSKAQAIRNTALAVLNKDITFKEYLDFKVIYKKLLTIKGIGPWTASMIMMRCFGDTDAFPEKDLIVERAVNNKLVDPKVWSSSRAYLTHCVWRDYGKSLSKKEKVNELPDL